MTETETGRTIIVAIFDQAAAASKALNKPEKAATSLEVLADQAIVVTMGEDGSLEFAASDHSAPRSTAAMLAKLLVVRSIGLKGALAVAIGGSQVVAAQRSRGDQYETADIGIGELISEMPPNSAAVIASYGDNWVDKAITSFKKLGAAKVWYTPESRVEQDLASWENPNLTT